MGGRQGWFRDRSGKATEERKKEKENVTVTYASSLSNPRQEESCDSRTDGDEETYGVAPCSCCCG